MPPSIVTFDAENTFREAKMIDLGEGRSGTNFQPNIRAYLGRLKAANRPMLLTDIGLMLDRLERAETAAAIREGATQKGAA